MKITFSQKAPLRGASTLLCIAALVDRVWSPGSGFGDFSTVSSQFCCRRVHGSLSAGRPGNPKRDFSSLGCVRFQTELGWCVCVWILTEAARSQSLRRDFPWLLTRRLRFKSCLWRLANPIEQSYFSHFVTVSRGDSWMGASGLLSPPSARKTPPTPRPPALR